MKRHCAVLWSFVFALALARAGWCQETAPKPKDVVRLETELGLAKAGVFYFVLHIESKTLELKARGLTFRSWTVVRLDQSGRRPAEGVATIVKKTAAFVPSRSKIKPEKESEEETPATPPPTPAAGEFDLQALEVHDMPDRFDIQLDSGLKLVCSPAKGGVSSFLAKTGRALWIPLKTLLLRVKNESFSTIEIDFQNKIESQALYWTALEGQKIFILNN